jgi:beta-lactamase class C
MKFYFVVAGVILGLAGWLGYTLLNPERPPVEFATHSVASNPHVDRFAADYEALVQQAFEEAGVPGAAVVLVHDTSVLVMQGLGLRDAGQPDSVDVHTVFRLGSVSKGFASVLTGTLVDDEQLDWSDKVQAYVPDFELSSPEQARRITIKHLLSHTTGLPYHAYTNLIEHGEAIAAVARRFVDVPLIASEGEIYSYQNAAFGLIEEVARTATGKSYPALVVNRLLAPLDMHDASVTHDGITGDPNRARPHVRTTRRGDARSWRAYPVSDKYYNAVSAGGINASIADMAQWLQLLLGNRPDVVSTAALDTIFTPVVATKNKRRYFRRWPQVQDAYYGLGWRVLDCGPDTLVYHGGYVNSYRSEIAVNRRERLAVCVLASVPGPFTNRCIRGAFDVYRQHADSIRWWEETQRYPLVRRELAE